MTSLRDMISFNAYLLRVSYIYQLKQRNIFLTVGDDEEFKTLIKWVWHLVGVACNTEGGGGPIAVVLGHQFSSSCFLIVWSL